MEKGDVRADERQKVGVADGIGAQLADLKVLRQYGRVSASRFIGEVETDTRHPKCG